MAHNKTILVICKGIWIRLLHHIARHIIPGKLRIIFHRMRGVKIGKNVLVGLDVHIDDSFPDKVTIEDNVFLTAGCMLLTHKRDLKHYEYGMWVGNCPFIVAPIHIKESAHIGIRTVILPGVTIGKGAIIGAHSLVEKDVPDYCVATGVPARVIKSFKPRNNENLD